MKLMPQSVFILHANVTLHKLRYFALNYLVKDNKFELNVWYLVKNQLLFRIFKVNRPETIFNPEKLIKKTALATLRYITRYIDLHSYKLYISYTVVSSLFFKFILDRLCHTLNIGDQGTLESWTIVYYTIVMLAIT